MLNLLGPYWYPVLLYTPGSYVQDGRVRDLAQLFTAKVKKVIEDNTKKLRIVEHLQVCL